MTLTTRTRPGARTPSLGAFSALAAVAALSTATGHARLAAQEEAAERFAEFVAVHAPVVALTKVKIIDGTGGPSREDMAIVIEDGRIAAIGPTAEVAAGLGNARVVDLGGHTVIPGLVGLHNHSYYTGGDGRAAQLSFSGSRLYLASGVTTIRTTGARAPYEELNLKAAIDAGRSIGPRMFTTGPYLTGEEGSQSMAHLDGAEEARRLVRYWAEEGVSWFKAYTWISREELGAAIEEAHRHGVKVTAHLCSVGYREAVALGIDNLEHGLFANSEYHPGKQPDDCPSGFRTGYAHLDVGSEEVQATFRDMIENDVAMTSTLAVYEISVPGRDPIDPRVYEMLAPEIAEEVRERAEFIRSATLDSGIGIHPDVYRKALEYEYAFVQAGGTLAAGVDPTGYGAAPPGLGDQANFELLLEAGFTPVEVVQIMSANGARVLGMDDLGTIEVGKLADLVVLEGDPEADGHIRDTRMVFKGGIGWDAPMLMESVRGIVGIR
ncbi:MAG: amidohydrolase family protein [Gemmatimonadetes bacterium]|nr:amidohydrolase family protein [Gemmatimonadota bacterium]